MASGTSKYRRLYGNTLIQLAVSMNKTQEEVRIMHQYGLLEKKENPMPEKMDLRLIKAWNGAKGRCTHPSPRNSKYYIDKGIKFRLTLEEVLILWNRDKAFKMECPSLDRRDSKKDYVFHNCRFIEWKENRVW